MFQTDSQSNFRFRILRVSMRFIRLIMSQFLDKKFFSLNSKTIETGTYNLIDCGHNKKDIYVSLEKRYQFNSTGAKSVCNYFYLKSWIRNLLTQFQDYRNRQNLIDCGHNKKDIYVSLEERSQFNSTAAMSVCNYFLTEPRRVLQSKGTYPVISPNWTFCGPGHQSRSLQKTY